MRHALTVIPVGAKLKRTLHRHGAFFHRFIINRVTLIAPLFPFSFLAHPCNTFCVLAAAITEF
jgi:hypothetical protein